MAQVTAKKADDAEALVQQTAELARKIAPKIMVLPSINQAQIATQATKTLLDFSKKVEDKLDQAPYIAKPEELKKLQSTLNAASLSLDALAQKQKSMEQLAISGNLGNKEHSMVDSAAKKLNELIALSKTEIAQAKQAGESQEALTHIKSAALCIQASSDIINLVDSFASLQKNKQARNVNDLKNTVDLIHESAKSGDVKTFAQTVSNYQTRQLINQKSNEISNAEKQLRQALGKSFDPNNEIQKKIRYAINLSKKGDFEKSKRYLQSAVKSMQVSAQNAFLARSKSTDKVRDDLNNRSDQSKKQPGVVKKEDLDQLALGYQRLSLHYKQMAGFSKEGKFKEAFSMYTNAERAKFLLDSALRNYQFATNMRSSFSNYVQFDKSMSNSKPTQALLRELSPLARSATELATNTSRIIAQLVPGKIFDKTILRVSNESLVSMNGLGTLSADIQKKYVSLKPGISACQQFIQDSLKFRNMALQMRAAGIDMHAVRAVEGNADRLMQYAKDAIEAPSQFSNAYLKNEMFAGEYGLGTRVNDTYKRAWTSISLMGYGKAGRSHPLWEQFAKSDTNRLKLALSPKVPAMKNQETVKRANGYAALSWRHMKQAQRNAFLVALEGKLLSSDSQLSALNSLSISMDAATKMYAAAINGKFATASQNGKIALRESENFTESYSTLTKINIATDAAGQAFHGVAAIFFPAIIVADISTEMLTNYKHMSELELATKGALAAASFIPAVGSLSRLESGIARIGALSKAGKTFNTLQKEAQMLTKAENVVAAGAKAEGLAAAELGARFAKVEHIAGMSMIGLGFADVGFMVERNNGKWNAEILMAAIQNGTFAAISCGGMIVSRRSARARQPEALKAPAPEILPEAKPLAPTKKPEAISPESAMAKLEKRLGSTEPTLIEKSLKRLESDLGPTEISKAQRWRENVDLETRSLIESSKYKSEDILFVAKEKRKTATEWRDEAKGLRYEASRYAREMGKDSRGYLDYIRQAEKKESAATFYDQTASVLEGVSSLRNPAKAAELLTKFQKAYPDIQFRSAKEFSQAFQSYLAAKIGGAKYDSFNHFISLNKTQLLAGGALQAQPPPIPVQASSPVAKPKQASEVTRAASAEMQKLAQELIVGTKPTKIAITPKPEEVTAGIQKADTQLTPQEVFATAKARDRIKSLLEKEQAGLAKTKEADIISLEERRTAALKKKESKVTDIPIEVDLKMAVGAETATASRLRSTNQRARKNTTSVSEADIISQRAVSEKGKRKASQQSSEEATTGKRPMGGEEATGAATPMAKAKAAEKTMIVPIRKLTIREKLVAKARAAKEKIVARLQAAKERRAEKRRQKLEAKIDQVAKELGIENVAELRSVAEELSGLRNADRKLAKVYEDAARKAMSDAKREGIDFSNPRLLQKSKSDILNVARSAVYEAAGIDLKPMSYDLSKHVKEQQDLQHINRNLTLADLESLFQIFIRGNLRKNCSSMAGIRGKPEFVIERMGGTTGAYKVTVVKGSKRVNVFVKETSLQPDILAKKLFSGTGIIIPNMKRAFYRGKNGTKVEYGIMQDVNHVKGVKKALSFRELGRRDADGKLMHEDVVEAVMKDPKIYEKIAYAFELSRKRGLQDRHASNVWISLKKNGKVEISMIDLDLVASYPKMHDISRSHISHINDVIEQLAFALEGTKLYSDKLAKILKNEQNVQTFSKYLKKDRHFIESLAEHSNRDQATVLSMLEDIVRNPERIGNKSWERVLKAKLIKLMLFDERQTITTFTDGVARAHNSDLKRYKFLLKTLRSYGGKPVGWGRSKKQILQRRHIGDESYKKTRSIINNKQQEIILEGPNAGRFLLEYESAKSMLDQQFGLSPLSNADVRLFDQSGFKGYWFEKTGQPGKFVDPVLYWRYVLQNAPFAELPHIVY